MFPLLQARYSIGVRSLLYTMYDKPKLHNDRR